MSPHDASAVPESVVAQIDRLCEAARCGQAPVYARLLQENVVDALHCSFPRFCEALSESELRALACAFLARHRAQRPQFHHIATEFVQFAQGESTLAGRRLCLLEYEWAQLAAEIDPACVPATSRDPQPARRMLATNPTLRIVALPFDAEHADEVPADASEVPRHLYAIYRTSRHVVLTQALFKTDCLLLAGVVQSGRLDPSVLVAGPAGADADVVATQWLAQALDHDLIHISA
jgi:hypothetical protein